MLKTKISAIALAVVLISAGHYAYAATDPCDPAVMTDLSKAAQDGFNKQDKIIEGLMKPPQPAAGGDGCMRKTFNVWAPDPVLAAAGAFFPPPTLALVGSAATLTDATPAALIVAAFNSAFGGVLDHLVCTDSWKTMANAKTPINIASDGSLGLGSIPSVSKSGDVIKFTP